MKNIFDKPKLAKNAIRINLILVTAIILSFNSFAWFVYSSRVSTGITTSVKAWRIDFQYGDNEVTEVIEIEIDSLYPGMEDYDNTINVLNHGETEASLSFEVSRFKILGDEYDTEEYTSEQLITMLEENYPFNVEFSVTNPTLDPDLGTSDFNIYITWPFESGDDELDTYWGYQAYLYNDENPGEPGFEINLKLKAIQVES